MRKSWNQPWCDYWASKMSLTCCCEASTCLQRPFNCKSFPYRSLLTIRLGQDEKVVETLGKTTVSVAKKLKKNKHQREEERQEMDRILGPAPIVDV